MVDSEKLSLCCSDEGRYLLLDIGGWRGLRGEEEEEEREVERRVKDGGGHKCSAGRKRWERKRV